MLVLIKSSNTPSKLPVYRLIKSIFVMENNESFLISNIYENNYFDEHFQVYNVKLCCLWNQFYT